LIQKRDLTTIPNLLSFGRIAGVTVAVALYLAGHEPLALGVGAVACLTDYFDGYLARKLKQETALGAMLDQAADSFTTAIALAMLVVAGGIPFAFLVIFLLREFWVATVRRYAASAGIDIPSAPMGKVATAMIYFAILAVAMAILPEMPELLSSLHTPAILSLGLGLAISCLTGWRYTKILGGVKT